MPAHARMPVLATGDSEAGTPETPIDRLVERLKRRYADRITGELTIPPRAARHAPFPDELDPALREAFARRGLTQLYSHQREAWDRVRDGQDIVVVTPTASGKTLCYNLPVLDAVRT
jgi:DEAD/DEAH box helicase domain-containing protein